MRCVVFIFIAPFELQRYCNEIGDLDDFDISRLKISNLLMFTLNIHCYLRVASTVAKSFFHV